jgi:hypothetical protein
MKMVECMEDEGPLRPKGETKSGVTHKNQVGSNSGSKSCNECKWGQGKSRFQSDKVKLVGKNRQQRKQNMNFSRSNVSIVTTMDIL